MPLYGQTINPYSKWKLQWLPSSKDNVDVFIYIKKQKLQNVFIYKNPDTFQKARQLPLRFILKKQDTLRYAIVHENFAVGI